MPKPLKRGVQGASTIILSKDIDKNAFMGGLNFYESDVKRNLVKTNGHEKWNASFRTNSNLICTSAFLPKRHNTLLPCSATFLQCRLAQTSMTSWQTDSNFPHAFHNVDF